MSRKFEETVVWQSVLLTIWRQWTEQNTSVKSCNGWWKRCKWHCLFQMPYIPWHNRVSLRKKYWLMADRVRSFFIKLTSESKYLGPFEIWSSWTNDSHTQFYYPLFIPCSAMLTCLRPRAVSKTSGTVFPNTNLRVNNIYLLHLKNHALH